MKPSEAISYALEHIPWDVRNVIVADAYVSMAFQLPDAGVIGCTFPHPIAQPVLASMIRGWRIKYQ